MKHIKITFLIVFLSSLLFSQERIILRTNGEQIKINHKKDLREAITETKLTNLMGKQAQSVFPKLQKIESLEDTISYREKGGSFNTNFGFFGQDVMMMWFEAPADMNIKAIGFTCSDDTGAENATVSLRLIKLNWTKEQLQNFPAASQIGYYPSSGDGFNETDYFGEEATGSWVSKDDNNPLPPWTDNADPAANTWDYDLWSDAGFGWPITPVASPLDAPVYQWVEAPVLDGITISSGDIFAVVANHDGTTLDSNRIGFWSDNSLGYPGWKYYENGRSASDVDHGWWVRMYTWDFAVAVDITGDMPPTISFLTLVITSMVTDPHRILATVFDTNPSGGDVGVAEVNLVYVLNETDTQKVAMVNIGGDDYEGYFPYNACSNTEYWVEAEDVNGNKSESRTIKFWSFCPETNVLLVFNGFENPNGYPQNFYFGTENSLYTEFTYDAWAYGPLTKELVDNYEFIAEICTTGPNDDNRDVIKTWLEEDNSDWGKWYLLAGDEWLSAFPSYPVVGYSPGDFEYDVLGLKQEYLDVSYDGTSGYELPSKFMPQEGTDFGDAMFNLAAQLNSTDSITIDSIQYNSKLELGINNWHDGFDIIEGDESIEVFMKAETRGIMGVPFVRDINVGISRTLDNNHIMFMSYDPLAISSAPYYYWFGHSSSSPQFQFYTWFNNKPSVNDNPNALKIFSLSQNYPNPFNPSTAIKYSIPTGVALNTITTTVTLKIYDILGREVATIVNKGQKAGNYEVFFDATNLVSGIYFYKLTAGNFAESKKMLLIK